MTDETPTPPAPLANGADGADLASPIAFVMAPYAPLQAMAGAFGQAYLQFWACQSRLMMATARTATDAWRGALRRQQDALFGSDGAGESLEVANDAGAIQAAADAVRDASLDLANAQAKALDLMRRSA
jgi:hypothetical protein